MIKIGTLLAFGLLSVASTAYAAGDALPDGVDPTTGFRMGNYRAPTPDTIPGGKVLTNEEALAASKGGRVMIDVVAEGVTIDAPTQKIVVSKPHDTIPGAIWMPGVGPGEIDAATTRYLEEGLTELTKGDKAGPLMFFCKADCWHSWNTARRAVLAGYTNVGWYPLGADGWRDQGLTLVPVEPRPRPGAPR
jgi:PQQ-dependent catabolism-associated CXXCW motif protein